MGRWNRPSDAPMSGVLARFSQAFPLWYPPAIPDYCLPDMFSYRPMTRGDLLAHSISYALIRARKIIRGLSYGLTQAERTAVVAQAAVDELRRHGDQWKLDEELPKGEVHSTPKSY